MASPDSSITRIHPSTPLIQRPQMLNDTKIVSDNITSGNGFQINGDITHSKNYFVFLCGTPCIARLGTSHGRSASYDGSSQTTARPQATSKRRYTDTTSAATSPPPYTSNGQGEVAETIDALQCSPPQRLFPVRLFDTEIGNAILDPTVKGNWMSMRMINRSGGKHPQIQTDVAKRAAAYNGRKLVSSGKYIDMRCRTKTHGPSTCVHRFYLMHGPPFDILLGSEIGPTVERSGINSC